MMHYEIVTSEDRVLVADSGQIVAVIENCDNALWAVIPQMVEDWFDCSGGDALNLLTKRTKPDWSEFEVQICLPTSMDYELENIESFIRDYVSAFEQANA